MREKVTVLVLASFLVVLAAAGPGRAALCVDSWIVRSTVKKNQSMWAPGQVPAVNLPFQQLQPSGPFQGSGVTGSLDLSLGTVSGNVEGNLKATYDDSMPGPGMTTIGLCYTGTEEESVIGTNVGVKVTAELRARFAMPPLGWPRFTWTVPGSAGAAISPKREFTTGLGTLVTASDKQEVIKLSGEAGILGGYAKLYVEQRIFFTPLAFGGYVKCTHLESGASPPAGYVLVGADGTEVSFSVDLYRKGHWEISLYDFALDWNTFRQELTIGGEIGFEILTFELGLGGDWLNLPGYEFRLDFEPHDVTVMNRQGLAIHRVGRFHVHVAPEPATVSLLGIGLLGLLRLSRRPKK
jgi:hypothetical protein